MAEKKKLILLITLILAVIIIGIVFYWKVLQPEREIYFDSAFDTCMQENNDAYYAGLAIQTGNEKYCEGNELCKGYARKDPSVCDMYESDRSKANCRAFMLKDPKQCYYMDDPWCLVQVTGDENHCYDERIDDIERQDCLNIARMNYEYYLSDKAVQECKDSAYFYAVAQTKDKITCENIADLKTREKCFNL